MSTTTAGLPDPGDDQARPDRITVSIAVDDGYNIVTVLDDFEHAYGLAPAMLRLLDELVYQLSKVAA